MLLSIVVPVYNVELYLSQCIESIVSQTYTNIELILVDDGSNDKSGILCDIYSKNDNRIRVIHQLNKGLSAARNIGISSALGDYILFMDSDDYWPQNNMLELFVELITQNPQIDFICFNCFFYYANTNRYIPWKAFSNLLQDTNDKNIIIQELIKSGTFPVSAWSKIIKRSFLLKNQIFFPEGIIAEDVPWFINLLDKAHNCKFVNQYVYAYRQNREGSITHCFTTKSFDDVLYIIKKELELLPTRTFDLATQRSLKSFFAYNFCILLAQINKLPLEVQENKRKELIYYCWLLRYTNNPKVKFVSFIFKIFGIKITEKLLNIYMLIK